MKIFVSTNWVFNNLKNKKLIILDCTWYLPNIKKNPLKEYNLRHIKNAQFFNIDEILNKKIKLPHMAPTSSVFEKKMRSFGINNDSIIVVYDSLGLFSSARVWWLFKYFGHNETYVMNGGLKKWLYEKKITTKKNIKFKKGNFKVSINRSLITNYKNILKKLNNKNIIILDARNEKRFKGLINEPRKGLRLGHIPYSKNLFWKKLINKNGSIQSKNCLKKVFNRYKIGLNKEVITTCGSGITACILSLALLHSKNIDSKVLVTLYI